MLVEEQDQSRVQSRSRAARRLGATTMLAFVFLLSDASPLLRAQTNPRAQWEFQQRRVAELSRDYTECRARLIDSRGSEREALGVRCREVADRRDRCQQSAKFCDSAYIDRLDALNEEWRECLARRASASTGGERLRVGEECQLAYTRLKRCEKAPEQC